SCSKARSKSNADFRSVHAECRRLVLASKNNRDTRTSLTRSKRDVVFKQRAVHSDDADRQLPESQQSCLSAAPAEDPVNPGLRTNEVGFGGSNGCRKLPPGAILLHSRL